MVTLIIDSSFLCHQAKFTMGNMSHGDLATGVLFGFLSRILVLGNQFETNDIIFAWDSKSSKRQKIFPEYKIKRRTNKTPEEIAERKILVSQMKLLRREILPLIGFNNNFVQRGCEADDVVAKVSQSWNGEFVLIASDEDLFQLLRNNVRMYNPTKRKMITVNSFTEEKGITPRQWVDVKTYAGCSGDGVPGVRGIGEKTCIEFLKGTLSPKSKKYKDIRNATNTTKTKLHRKLVQLPFPSTKDFIRKRNSYTMEGLAWVANTYGMSSFLKKKKQEEWKEFFMMDKQTGIKKKRIRKPKRNR